jgi:FlaA1/EpsC-like NDP-sugar epimerase
LIRLSGKEEGRDVDILVTGLRSGEKMTERLFRDEEHIERTLHEKILVTRNGHSERMFTGFALKIDELLDVARSGSIDEVKSLITKIVPESMITNMADSEEELILEESHD